MKNMKKFAVFVLSIAIILQFSLLLNFVNIPKAKAVVRSLTSADCGATLDIAGDTYELSENMSCTGSGLIVGADGITIDGESADVRHTLSGDGDEDDYGIYNNGGWNNITVQNFSGINNFGFGIMFVASSDNNIFINNTLTSNIGGFYLADSSSNILTGNTISSSFYGISQT
ncbi:MAG: DUF1565 domain-containing protein, partial [Candidatus Berkelbacteria bacterium]|nr:DUF1565 domain-containing protein [Candidatus Berkelbacteria bacterium]